MKVVTSQANDGEYGLLDSSTGSAVSLTSSRPQDHGETTTLARPLIICTSEACATATESKVTAPKEERQFIAVQSFPREHDIFFLPSPAEEPAAPHNNSFANEAEAIKQTAVIEDLQATLLALKRAEARVALLQSKFDKVERLEQDLGIYEILGEDGKKEFRERVEAIKRQKSVPGAV